MTQTRELKIGWLGWALPLWVCLQCSSIPLAVQAIEVPEWPLWLAPTSQFTNLGVSLVFALGLLFSLRRMAPGTRGNARLRTLAFASLLRALGTMGFGILLWVVLSDPDLPSLLYPEDGIFSPVDSAPMETVQLTISALGLQSALFAALVVWTIGTLGELVLVISTWFLLPQTFRLRFWVVVDLIVLTATLAALLLLPARPLSDAPQALTLPALRLALVCFGSLRGLTRLVPWALNLIEQSGFQLQVAARLLRARKSGFLNAIGALSIFAVTVSSCTLCTTLSIMGGFRNDLKRKILGNNAHVVIDHEGSAFEGWLPTLEQTRAEPGVIGASPYVSGEVMITSATNHEGAILRGIDPATIGDVTEMPRNLRHGRLEYLANPRELTRIRAEEMGHSLLNPARPENHEGLLDSAREAIEDLDEEASGPSPAANAERQERDDEFDAFLRENDPVLEENRPVAAATEAPVLPGLIVGQELARTLRLHVGDEVNVISPLGDLGPMGPMPRTRAFRVAGIFYSGMYEYDLKMAYTTLEAAQRFLNLGDAISGIEIKLEDAEQAEQYATQIAAAIGRPTLRVQGWQAVNRTLFGALALEKLAMFITLGIAILVASFCIVGTLTLMVQEKGKEVGVLKAMGTRSSQIIAIFMAQGLMIGVLGASVGLGLGYTSCWAMEHFGIRLNPEIYYIDRLPVHIDGLEFAMVGLATVLICLLATIYPALLGSRLRPVDALRYG